MGALMTNSGSCDVYGSYTVASAAHQLTTNIDAAEDSPGAFMMNCASRITLGPNDYALFSTRNHLDPYVPVPPNNTAIVAGIAKIDYALLPPPSLALRSVRAQETKMAPVAPSLLPWSMSVAPGRAP
jgi:hypothetical protein